MKYTLLSCAALALILPFSAYACPGEGPYESRQNMKMEKLDTDKNGALSTAEANAGAMMHFKAMDTNADGILSAAEFEKAPRPYNKEGKDDGATWRDRKSLSERLGLRRDKRFAVMDTDGNGSVSQSEFLAGAEKRHEMMDANKDGTITREEMVAGREKMKETWQDRRGDRGWG
ncbi:MAG TPA: EF-hand domain-containing protein, partial [Alphaproteobacteria bacterium]|nr:EF-hand domain-containing protein [Alphaproteobacteria bacterium]